MCPTYVFVYLCIRAAFWTGLALLSMNVTWIIIIIIIYCRQLTLFHCIEHTDSVIRFIIIIIIIIIIITIMGRVAQSV